jgi:hypothetical protein
VDIIAKFGREKARLTFSCLLVRKAVIYKRADMLVGVLLLKLKGCGYWEGGSEQSC